MLVRNAIWGVGAKSQPLLLGTRAKSRTSSFVGTTSALCHQQTYR